MRTKVILAIAVSVGLIAAGCGGEDEPGVDASGSISKEEWIAQAGEICTEGERAIEAEAGRFFSDAGGEPDEQAELEFQTEVVVPAVERQVRGVAALPRPEGDEDEIAAIVAAAERGLAEARADPSAFESDQGGLAESERLIAAYGVKGCS